MNITNLEMIQASIEVFCGLIGVIMAITLKMNSTKHTSMKMFVYMFVLSSTSFFLESAAYIFRGNVGTFSIAVTRIANFGVFTMNLLLANLFIRYIYYLCKDNKAEVNRTCITVANAFTSLGFLILVINLINNWMYYFDESNYYHRNNMWYVYTVIAISTLVVGAFLAVKCRKQLGISRFISILAFALIPIVSTTIQLFVYGIAIINICIGIGIVGLLIVYIYGWINSDTNQLDETKKHKWLDVMVLFLIMVISMSASIVSLVVSIHRISESSSEFESKTVASMVADGIENRFIRPITVAETMSRDYSMRLYLGQSEKSAEDIEDEFSAYLESIRSGFGYQMVYAVSDVSKAYHTYNGIVKYIDTENDPHDVWYRDFLLMDEYSALNVDTDEANNWNLSVFVNTRVLNQSGDLVGVCGIGVDMQELIDYIAAYENEYDIKINLVNKDGLIQIDSEFDRIENEYVDNSYFGSVTGDEIYYKLDGDVSYLTKYMDALGWYLVVRDNNPYKLNVAKMVIPSIIVFIAGAIVMGIAFAVITIRENKASDAYRLKYKDSVTDKLTGLFNRRKFEEDCEKIKSLNVASEYVIVMLDVNGLKNVNDQYGHEAGDELLIAAADCIKNVFSEYGDTYRVGGDEFVALLKCTKDRAYGAASKMDNITSQWHGRLVKEISISKGIAVCADYPEMDINECKSIADKLMYADKSEYYKRTGNDRRRS